jgi:hypothetical protein
VAYSQRTCQEPISFSDTSFYSITRYCAFEHLFCSHEANKGHSCCIERLFGSWCFPLALGARYNVQGYKARVYVLPSRVGSLENAGFSQPFISGKQERQPILNGESVTAFCPTCLDNFLSVLGGHSFQKAASSFNFDKRSAQCSLHWCNSWGPTTFMFWRGKT